MYFPYLRGRQFELIAIRELASEDALQNKIVPVVEPVKESLNSLDIAHRSLLENNFSIYLIVNPFEGVMKGDDSYFLEYISNFENSKYIPAFLFSDNHLYISSMIEKYQLAECMLICLDNFSDEDSLKELILTPEISHIMLFEPHKNRGLVRFIRSKNKKIIRLDDNFEKQKKNADFLKIETHKFTEEHLYYLEDNYDGFADFTALPSEFIEGGSTPRAVVIHITYLNPSYDNQIWIKHFTSITNDSISNVQGKFAEAALKAVKFCRELPLTNSAIEELKYYVNEKKYPGLGIVKKISIKNHLLVVSEYLDSLC